MWAWIISTSRILQHFYAPILRYRMNHALFGSNIIISDGWYDTKSIDTIDMILLKVNIDTTNSVPLFQCLYMICKWYCTFHLPLLQNLWRSTFVFSVHLSQQKGFLLKLVSRSQLGKVIKYKNDFVP